MWASSSSELSIFVSGPIAANQAEKMFRPEQDGGAGFHAFLRRIGGRITRKTAAVQGENAAVSGGG